MSRTKYPIFKCLRRGQKGFTLIELLVVIAILGVIAAVAIPNITQFMGSGETEAAAAELHNVQVAASAALYAATTNSSVTFVEYATAQQLDPGSASGTGDTQYYLINPTAYTYTISSTGLVTQGAKAS